MLAAIATYFLRKALGWLVEGLEPENFELSLWSGEVVLRDLQVKGDALALLGLPIAVKSGKVALLRLRIPWRALGSDQVVVEIHGLNVVAAPKNELDRFDPEAEQEAALAARQAAVDALATTAGISEAATSEAAAAAAATSDQAPGLVASYITSIVDNCRVEIKDTHIRLEDSSSSDLPFALGIELSVLTLESVDMEWNVITDAEVAEKEHGTGMIRKAISVRDLAIYLEPMNEPLRSDRGSPKGRSGEGDYILQPCSISVRVNFDDTMVGGNGPPRRVRSTTPEISANMQWPHIGLHLQKIQYQHLINFGAFTSTYSLRFENRQHRPATTVSEDPAAWWRYAIFSIRDSVRVELKKRSWSNLHVALKHRKKYVALYMLRDESYATHVGKRVLNGKNKAGEAQLKAIEAKLTVEQVKAFRKHAGDKLRDHKATRAATGIDDDSDGGMVGVLMSPFKSLGNLFAGGDEGNESGRVDEGDEEKSNQSAKTAISSDSPGGFRGRTNPRGGSFRLVERESLRLTVLIGQFSVSLDNTRTLIDMPSSTELSLDRITANFCQRDTGMRAELSMGSIQVGYMKSAQSPTQTPEIIIGPGEYQHPSLSFQPGISGSGGSTIDGGEGGPQGGSGRDREGGEFRARLTPGPFINVVYETVEGLGAAHREQIDTDKDITENPTYFPIIAHLDVQVKRVHLVWSASFIQSLVQFITLDSSTEKEREQMDAIVFTTVAEARRLRDVGEARAKDAMRSSSRIFISGTIETPDIVLAALPPLTKSTPERAWAQRSWLLIRLGTLTVESDEILSEIFANECVPSPGGESKRSSLESTLTPRILATYDKMDIVLDGTQILFFEAHRKMQGDLIDAISIEVEFERCLAQTTVETPGLRIGVRLPNTGINISPAALRALTDTLESISPESQGEENMTTAVGSSGPISNSVPESQISESQRPRSPGGTGGANVRVASRNGVEKTEAHGLVGFEEPTMMRADVLEDLRKARLEHGGANISTGTATVRLKDRLWLQKAVTMQMAVAVGELRVNLIDHQINACVENDSNVIVSTLKVQSLDFKLLQRSYDMSMLLELGHLSVSDRFSEINVNGDIGDPTVQSLPERYFVSTDECIRQERQCNATYTLTEYIVRHSPDAFLKLRLMTTSPESPSYADREQCRGSPDISVQIRKLAIFVDGRRLGRLIDYTNRLQPTAENVGAETSTQQVPDENASSPASVPAPLSSGSAPPLVLDVDIDEIGVYFSGSPIKLHLSELSHSNSTHSRVRVLGINAHVEMGMEKIRVVYRVEDIQICDDTITVGSAYKTILGKETQSAGGIPRDEAGKRSMLRCAQLVVASSLFSEESWMMPVCKAPRTHNIIVGTFLQFSMGPESVQYPGFPMVIDTAVSRLRVVYSARSVTNIVAVINDHIMAVSPPVDGSAGAVAAAAAEQTAPVSETVPSAPGTMPLLRVSILDTLVVMPVASFCDDHLALSISRICLGNGSLNYGFDVQPVPKHHRAFVLLPKALMHEEVEQKRGEEGNNVKDGDNDNNNSYFAVFNDDEDEDDAKLSTADLSKFMLFVPSGSRRGSIATDLESNFDEDEFTDAEGDSVDDPDEDHEFTDAESVDVDEVEEDEDDDDDGRTSPEQTSLRASHRLTQSLQRIDALAQRFNKRRRKIVDEVQTELNSFAVSVCGLRVDAHQCSLRANIVPLVLPFELEVIAGLPTPSLSSNTRVGLWLNRLHLNITTENLAFVNGLLANNLAEEAMLPQSALQPQDGVTALPSIPGTGNDTGSQPVDSPSLAPPKDPPTWCAKVDRQWKQDTIVCLNWEGIEISMAEPTAIRDSNTLERSQSFVPRHVATFDIGPLHVEYDVDSRQQSSRILLELDYLIVNDNPPRHQTDVMSVTRPPLLGPNGIARRRHSHDFLVLPPKNSKGRCLNVCVNMYSHVADTPAAEVDGSHMFLTIETSKLDIHSSKLLNPLQTLFTSADGELDLLFDATQNNPFIETGLPQPDQLSPDPPVVLPFGASSIYSLHVAGVRLHLHESSLLQRTIRIELGLEAQILMRDDNTTANIRCLDFCGVSIHSDDRCCNIIDPCSFALNYIALGNSTQKGEISLSSGVRMTARLSQYNIVNDAIAEMMPPVEVSDNTSDESSDAQSADLDGDDDGEAKTRADVELEPTDKLPSSPVVDAETISSAEKSAPDVRFEILLGPINVSVINDLGRGDVPLMRAALYSPKRLLYSSRQLTPLIVQTQILCSLSIALDYFNVPLSTWEPLLEMWTLQLKVCMPRVKRSCQRRPYYSRDETLLKKAGFKPEDDLEVVANTYLKIKAPDALNVNVSQVCLNSIFNTTALLGETLADEESTLIPRKNGNKLQKSSARFSEEYLVVNNEVGGDIECWVSEDLTMAPEKASHPAEQIRRHSRFKLMTGQGWRCQGYAEASVVRINHGSTASVHVTSGNAALSLTNEEDNSVLAIQIIDRSGKAHPLPPIPLDRDMCYKRQLEHGHEILDSYDPQGQQSIQSRGTKLAKTLILGSNATKTKTPFLKVWKTQAHQFVCDVECKEGIHHILFRSCLAVKNKLNITIKMSFVTRLGRQEISMLPGSKGYLPCSIFETCEPGLMLHRSREEPLDVSNAPEIDLPGCALDIYELAKDAFEFGVSFAPCALPDDHPAGGSFRACASVEKDSSGRIEYLEVVLVPTITIENLIPSTLKYQIGALGGRVEGSHDLGHGTLQKGRFVSLFLPMPALKQPFRELPVPVVFSFGEGRILTEELSNLPKNADKQFYKWQPVSRHVALVNANSRQPVSYLEIEVSPAWIPMRSFAGFKSTQNRELSQRAKQWVPLHMRVKAPYWIINRTSLNLDIVPRGPGSVKIVRGFDVRDSAVVEASDVAESKNPNNDGESKNKTLFSPKFPLLVFGSGRTWMKKSTVSICVRNNDGNESELSLPIPLLSVGVEQDVTIDDGCGGLLSFGINIVEAPAPYQALVVTICPRYVLVNRLDYAIALSQPGATERDTLRLEPKESLPFHWRRSALPKQLKVKPLSYSEEGDSSEIDFEWSGAFEIDKVATNVLPIVGLSYQISSQSSEPPSTSVHGLTGASERIQGDLDLPIRETYMGDWGSVNCIGDDVDMQLHRSMFILPKLGLGQDRSDDSDELKRFHPPGVPRLDSRKNCHVRVKTAVDGPIVFVCFDAPDPAFPLYRIVNATTCASLRVLQRNVAASRAQVILPLTSQSYAWTEPLEKRALLIEATPCYDGSSPEARNLKRESLSSVLTSKKNILKGVASITARLGSSMINTVTSAGAGLYEGVFGERGNVAFSPSGRPLSRIGFKPHLGKSLREYTIDEIDRHKDLVVQVGQVGYSEDGEALPPRKARLRVEVYQDGQTKVIHVTDLPVIDRSNSTFSGLKSNVNRNISTGRNNQGSASMQQSIKLNNRLDQCMADMRNVAAQSELPLSVRNECVKSFKLYDGVAPNKIPPFSQGQHLLLYVEVVSARDLLAADITGDSDPYAVCWLGSETTKPTRSNTHQFKTKYISSTLYPNWYAHKIFDISDWTSPTSSVPLTKRVMHVHIWDRDAISSHDSLGVVQLPLTNDVLYYALQQEIDVWCSLQPDEALTYDLSSPVRGDVRIRFRVFDVANSTNVTSCAKQVRHMVISERILKALEMRKMELVVLRDNLLAYGADAEDASRISRAASPAVDEERSSRNQLLEEKQGGSEIKRDPGILTNEEIKDGSEQTSPSTTHSDAVRQQAQDRATARRRRLVLTVESASRLLDPTFAFEFQENLKQIQKNSKSASAAARERCRDISKHTHVYAVMSLGTGPIDEKDDALPAECYRTTPHANAQYLHYGEEEKTRNSSFHDSVGRREQWDDTHRASIFQESSSYPAKISQVDASTILGGDTLSEMKRCLSRGLGRGYVFGLGALGFELNSTEFRVAHRNDVQAEAKSSALNICVVSGTHAGTQASAQRVPIGQALISINGVIVVGWSFERIRAMLDPRARPCPLELRFAPVQLAEKLCEILHDERTAINPSLAVVKLKERQLESLRKQQHVDDGDRGDSLSFSHVLPKQDVNWNQTVIFGEEPLPPPPAKRIVMRTLKSTSEIGLGSLEHGQTTTKVKTVAAKEYPDWHESQGLDGMRWLRISLYSTDPISSTKPEQDGAEMNHAGGISQKDVDKNDLVPLVYFFGGNPAREMEVAESQEPINARDVLIGQTCVCLPLGFENAYDAEHHQVSSMAADYLDGSGSDSENEEDDNPFPSDGNGFDMVLPLTLLPLDMTSTVVAGSAMDRRRRQKAVTKKSWNKENSSQTTSFGSAGEIRIRLRWEPVLQDLSSIQSLACDVNLKGIGLSLIDGTPKELLYLSVRDIILAWKDNTREIEMRVEESPSHFDGKKLLQTTMTVGKQFLELKVMNLQIDNQLIDAAHHVLFGPSEEEHISDKKSGKKRPVVHLSTVISAAPTPDISTFDTLIFGIQAFDLNLDEAFLIEMISFAMGLDFSGSEDDLRNRADALLEDQCFKRFDIEKSNAKVPEGSSFVYFRYLHIHPIRINITFSTEEDAKIADMIMGGDVSSSSNPISRLLSIFINMVGGVLSNIDDAPLKLDALIMPHCYASSEELSTLISSHYVSKIIPQLLRILISLEVLGNPIGLIEDVGSGVISLFYEPAMGAMQSPEMALAGLGKGTKQVLTSSITGLANMGGKVTEAATKLVSHLAMDEQYLRDRSKRQKQNQHGPQHVGDGILMGGKDLSRGVYEGVKGLVMNPIDGFRKGGMKGFGVGVLKGLAGCIVKPTAGAMDLIHHTFIGIKNTAGYIDGTQGVISRIRTPRYFSPDGMLCWYSTREAAGFAIVILLGKLGVESYLYHVSVESDRHKTSSSAESHILLVTDTHVRTIKFILKRGKQSMKILREQRVSCLLKASYSDRTCSFAIGHHENIPLSGVPNESEESKSRDNSSYSSSNILEVISVKTNSKRDAFRVVKVVQEHMAGDTRDARKQAILWDLKDKYSDILPEDGQTMQKMSIEGKIGQTVDRRPLVGEDTPATGVEISSSQHQLPQTISPRSFRLSQNDMRRARGLVDNLKLIMTRASVVGFRKADMRKSFTLYAIAVIAPWPMQGENSHSISWRVERRFREFVKLRSLLMQGLKQKKKQQKNKDSIESLAKLPPKRVLNNRSQAVVQARVSGLSQFLLSTLNNEHVGRHGVLIAFLSTGATDFKISN